ncbi:hypothetical protein ACJX0J_023192 [Zea mays]
MNEFCDIIINNKDHNDDRPIFAQFFYAIAHWCYSNLSKLGILSNGPLMMAVFLNKKNKMERLISDFEGMPHTQGLRGYFFCNPPSHRNCCASNKSHDTIDLKGMADRKLHIYIDFINAGVQSYIVHTAFLQSCNDYL